VRIDLCSLTGCNADNKFMEGNIMADALIIDACRSPRGIGKAGKGALSGIHPQQLGATVLRALADRSGIDTADVDDIIWGTSSKRGPPVFRPSLGIPKPKPQTERGRQSG
jgi:acetyl-CoA acetyltransferase